MNNQSRRKFLYIFSGCLASAPIWLRAESPSLVDPKTNQLAKTLGYVHEAKNYNRDKYASVYKQGSNCQNCQLYTQPNKDPGPCTLFPGKLVKSSGWCSGWVKRP